MTNGLPFGMYQPFVDYMQKGDSMTFTDEDLKRLKEYYCKRDGCICNQFKALLARLEAETNAADLLELHHDSGVYDDLDEGDVALIAQALEARRKAAGK